MSEYLIPHIIGTCLSHEHNGAVEIHLAVAHQFTLHVTEQIQERYAPFFKTAKLGSDPNPSDYYPKLSIIKEFNYLRFAFKGCTKDEFLQHAFPPVWAEIAGPIICPCGDHTEAMRAIVSGPMPTDNIPCPCGNPTHWLVKWEDRP
jgi:hypothetical protein